MTGIFSFILIVLMGMSVSIKGNGLNDEPPTENQFLIYKWNMFSKALDANHDGKLSTEDCKGSQSKFTDFERLDSEQTKSANIIFTNYWQECIFKGNKSEILQQDFVDSLKMDFNADTEAFVNETGRCFKMLFSAIDTNKDRSISEEEFIITHTAVGHQQIVKDNAYFLAYKPMNGLVPLQVIVDSWIDLVASTDETKGNAIISGFEAHGFE